jgi:vanillin dehydrogenase
MNQQQMYIDGKWSNAEGNKTFESYNPATGKVHSTIADASLNDTKLALQAAANAQPAWASLPHTERVKYMHKIADVLETMTEEFTEALVNETGSWIGKAGFECSATPEEFRTAASLIYQATGEILPSANGKTSMLIRKPVGVVSVISPWNFPMLLSARGFAPAIALGNTVVLKPSEESSISGGILFAKACEKADLPAGVFNVITCSRNNVTEVGDELVANPVVKTVSFTGSTAVGKHIGSRAGNLLKKTCLELGGKDAIIILDDADLGLAVNAATFGAFMHQGQICMSTERVIVHKDIAEEFGQRFAENVKKLHAGDPWDITKPIGPIINKKQLDKIIEQVEDAKSKGAEVLVGGIHNKLFYDATVLSKVTNDMKIIQEENFGPVAPILIAQDIEHAIQIHNDCEYGLSSSIITVDVAKGLEVAARLHAGMTHINDSTVNHESHVPFGGVKNSGLGGHGGKASLAAFTEMQWVTITKDAHYPPFFEEN